MRPLEGGAVADCHIKTFCNSITIAIVTNQTEHKITYTYGLFTSFTTAKLGVQTDQNGLYYMRARYYNTDIKRFINRDTVSGDLTNSQSLNKYSYVQGNPVSLTDPFGLSPIDGDAMSIVSQMIHTALDIGAYSGMDSTLSMQYITQ